MAELFQAAFDAVLNAVKGLANWIGLGDWITETTLEESDLQSVWTKLQNALTDKLNKGNLDLAKVESQLMVLDQAGYSLTGNAARAWENAKERLKSKRDAINSRNAKNSVKIEEAQSYIDRSKSTARSWGFTSSDQTQSNIAKAEALIGELQ